MPEAGPSETKEHLVRIEINHMPYEVPPGPIPVAKLKEIGAVAQADELLQIIDGKLVPLLDSGVVDIKSGEKFVSQPRTGTSS